MARIPARRALALILLLTLAAPLAPAGAATRSGTRARAGGSGDVGPRGLGATASASNSALFWWGLVATLPPYLSRPLSAWLGSGCSVGPNGNPICGTASSDTERGCGSDPNGLLLCSPKAASDRGCGIDPNGKLLCGSAEDITDAERGCGADPDGKPLCLGH